MLGSSGAPERKTLGNSSYTAAGQDAQLLHCLEQVSHAEQQLNTHVLLIQQALQETRLTISQLCSGPDHHQKPEAAEGYLVPPDEPDISADTVPRHEFFEETERDLVPPTEPAIARGTVATNDFFEEMQAMQKLAPGIAAVMGVVPEELIRAHEEWCKAEKDEFGALEFHATKPLLNKLLGHELSQSEFQRIVKELDFDENETLNFEELLHIYCNTPAKKMLYLEDRLWTNQESFAQFRLSVVGVEATAVKEYLKREIQEMNACLAIPGLFLMFGIFWLSTSWHLDSLRTSGMEHAFRMDVEENANFAFTGAVPFENGRMGHKNIYDVNSFADFWSWMSIGLVPLLFPESWDVSEARANAAASCRDPAAAMSTQGWPRNFSTLNQSGSFQPHLGEQLCRSLGEEPTPPKEFVREWAYLFFNSRVAGLRLRQEQLPIVGCYNVELQGKAYDTACTEDAGFWILPTFSDAVGMDLALVNKTGGETVYLLAGQSQVEIQRQLRSLEDQAWLSQRTGRVELVYTTYNAHLNLVTGMYIYFFVNRGGHIHKFIKTISIPLNPHAHIGNVVADLAFAIAVVTMFIAACRQVCSECRELGLKNGFRKYFRSISNYIELFTIAWGVVILSASIIGVYKTDRLTQFLSTASTSITGGWADSSEQERYFTEIDEILEWMQYIRTMLALYPLFLFLRILLAFHQQPRLALITQTFYKAGTSLVHFAVVLGSAILTFSAMAQIWFGHQVEGFETTGLSVITVFRALLGDINYEALVRTGRPMAISWYVGFTVMVQLIMLNMTLAIIMDAYSDVKNSIAADAETLWSQSAEILRRWYDLQRGRRISLEKVIHYLSGVRSVITVSSLLKNVKGLEIAQATRIISNTVSHVDLEKRLSASAEMADRIRRIELRTKIIVQSQTRHHRFLGGEHHCRVGNTTALAGSVPRHLVAGQASLGARSSQVSEQVVFNGRVDDDRTLRFSEAMQAGHGHVTI